MKLICAASIFILTVMCNFTLASSKNYKNAEEFIKSIPHASAHYLVAEGDLNGDNLKDLAIVVKTKPREFERYNQLHVLILEKPGKYSLAVSSRESPIAGMGCCWLENMEIKNGSIFIQNNAKTACDIEAATHQFKLYKKTWRLIGLKIFNYQHCEDPQLSEVRDFNILTGKIIKSKQLDDNPKKYEYMEFTPNKFLLKDYDFFNGFGAPET
ncbi:hypothetical protein [Pseudomonas sp. EA_35y_Pfl2_R111]|uniref:hypothetical protein n=1 Tax=Pseudomonas sp. EA_35y_Pfl2_R111 TaxID=3088689 RepID=UPI0030D842B9